MRQGGKEGEREREREREKYMVWYAGGWVGGQVRQVGNLVGGEWIGTQQMQSVDLSKQDVMLRDLQKTPCGGVQLMNKYTLLYVIT